MRKNDLLLASTFGVLISTSVASASFIIEDEPVPGSSYTQRIIAPGLIDYIAFVIDVDGGGGPFEAPFLSVFGDPSNNDAPIAGWTTAYDSDAFAVAGAGPSAGPIAVVLHFAGDIGLPVSFHGIAYRDGVRQYSADFVWDPSGFGSFMSVINKDQYDPDPGSLPSQFIPLPAPIWLGSLGLMAVLVIRRRLT